MFSLAVSARRRSRRSAARDSQFYREASEQAWLFIRAVPQALEETR